MKNILKYLINIKNNSRFIRNEVLVFPASKLEVLISTIYPKVLYLSLNRISNLYGRARIGKNFLSFIFKMNRNHGAYYSVKWLKACAVALQKYLGNDKLSSLRELEPNLPLPRLINGCPSIINKGDRFLIRKGDKGVIRFWLTLFNLYRVWSIPGKLKLSSIIGPYTGSSKIKEDLMEDLINRRASILSFLKKSQKITMDLAPTHLVFSSSASPSCTHSYEGIFTDAYLLWRHKMNFKRESRISDANYIISQNIEKYLEIVTKDKDKKMFNIIHQVCELSYYYKKYLKQKKSMVANNGLSQLALKEEAAGKVRVFALVDVFTQSILNPLHKYLFSILKEIPNDGTFDQDSSVQRSKEKAKLSGKAYSFDLTSATDRIPADLTGSLLEALTGLKGLGSSWYQLVTNRPFSFNPKALSKLIRDGDVPSDTNNLFYYSVGQPMGCLSSWAALAVTHHYFLQICSFNLGLTKIGEWAENYEVLGDDLVIFNKELADEYLKLMENLGIEINLSKSIVSHELDVFEFAKRTFYKGYNVSAIPLKQVLCLRSLSERIANCWSFIQSFEVDSISVINKVSNRRLSSLWSESRFEALGYLNLLFKNNYIEWRFLVDLIVDPRKWHLLLLHKNNEKLCDNSNCHSEVDKENRSTEHLSNQLIRGDLPIKSIITLMVCFLKKEVDTTTDSIIQRFPLVQNKSRKEPFLLLYERFSRNLLMEIYNSILPELEKLSSSYSSQNAIITTLLDKKVLAYSYLFKPKLVELYDYIRNKSEILPELKHLAKQTEDLWFSSNHISLDKFEEIFDLYLRVTQLSHTIDIPNKNSNSNKSSLLVSEKLNVIQLFYDSLLPKKEFVLKRNNLSQSRFPKDVKFIF